MKTLIHSRMLGLILLLLIPGAALACLFLVAAAGSSITYGFEPRFLPAMVIFLIPPALIWRGLRLISGLRHGFHSTLRRKLLAFYLVTFAYCALWLFGPVTRNGESFMLFSIIQQVAGSIILIAPILITLFTGPEEMREWHPLAGDHIRINGRGDRFVSWIASRIR